MWAKKTTFLLCLGRGADSLQHEPLGSQVWGVPGCGAASTSPAVYGARVSKCCGISLAPQGLPALPRKTAHWKAPYEDPLEDPQVVLDAEEEPTNPTSAPFLPAGGQQSCCQTARKNYGSLREGIKRKRQLLCNNNSKGAGDEEVEQMKCSTLHFLKWVLLFILRIAAQRKAWMWTDRKAVSRGCDHSSNMKACFSISSLPWSDWFMLWPQTHSGQYHTEVPE